LLIEQIALKLAVVLNISTCILNRKNNMKNIFILSLILISYLGLHAQSQPRAFHVKKPINMAAILAPQRSLILGFRSVSEARSIINDIMDVANIQQNFKVLSTSQIDNAAAVMYQNERYILYNPSFINNLDNAANDKWASISVIGHEIGHHLLGHTLDGAGSQIPKELEADEFSGLVLHRMGASLQQSQLAMQLISSPYATATHPAQRDRLAAIARGWNNTSIQPNRENRDVAIDYPNDRRTTNPNPNYPTNNEGRDYPTNDRRTTHPNSNDPNYPSRDGAGRNYPSDGRQRTYPGEQSRPSSRGTNNYPGYPSQNNRSNAETIVYNVKFKRGNGEQYFITSQNNVVKYNRRGLSLVAKITATNRSNYPYVIYDDQTQLYVDSRGNIYSDRGSNVGLITPHR
jgi:hypothetical protein